MPLTWRYLVHPGGSFTRFMNIDGALDSTSDEQLEKLAAYARRSDADRPRQWCSRCGGDLTLSWKGPGMTGVLMELCPACDADRPAAAAFIWWHLDPDRDPDALPRLFEDWENETMHDLGFERVTPPEEN
jgi:hypothetical protein